MKKLTNLDVLIVYAESLAKSASDVSAKNLTPFSSKSKNSAYNDVYGYFLETCAEFNLTAGFSTSADIIGPGFCRSFWIYKDKKWLKVNSPCFSALIFDKFSPTKTDIQFRRQLLFSSDKVKSFNDPSLFSLFFDKQKTYDKLSGYAIPTVSLEDPTLSGINHACEKLAKLISQHPASKDFTGDIVMKNKFGAGGRHVYKLKPKHPKKMLAITHRHQNVSFIIQPFVRFDLGFSYRKVCAPTDIRLVYLKGKIVQSYIRVAKSGEFRCNEHQGGLLTYLSLEEIPDSLVAKSNLIAEILDKKCSLFTLDFIISNNGNSYLLEGNTGPGLDWNVSLKKNEIEAKKLIRLIVEELAIRSAPEPIYRPKLSLLKPIFVATKLKPAIFYPIIPKPVGIQSSLR